MNDNLSPSYVSRLGNPGQSPQPIGQQHYGAAPRTPLPSSASPRPGPGSYLLSPQPQYPPQGQPGYPTPSSSAFLSPKYRNPASPPRQALAVPAVSMMQAPQPQSGPSFLRFLLIGSILVACGLLLYAFLTKPTIVQVTMCDKSEGGACKADSYDTYTHHMDTHQTKEDEEYLSHFFNREGRYLTVQSRLDIRSFYVNEFKNELYSALGISRDAAELEVIPVKRKLKEGNTVLEIIIELHHDAYAEETMDEIQSILKDNVKGIRDRYQILQESLNLHQDEAILGGTATVKLSYAPTLTMSGGGTICQGHSGFLLFTISGGSPGRYMPSSWDVTYENTATHKKKTLKIHSLPHKEEITEPGTYKFIVPDYGDEACPPYSLAGEATFTMHPLPTAKLTSGTSGCTTDKDFAIHLSLGGIPPFSITYSVDGEEFTEDHIDNPTYQLVPSKHGTYRILSVKDKFCENDHLTSIPAITVMKGPSASVTSSTQNQCLGSKTGFEFSGKAPFRMRFYNEADGKSSAKEITIHSTQYETPFNKSGIYHIESVTDATGCKVTEADIVGSPLHVRAAPVAAIQVHGNTCNGAKASIELKLQGTAPWTPHFTYVGEPDKKVLLDYRSEIFSSPHYINVTEPGTFHLTRLQDAYCSNDQALSAKVAGNPQAKITGGQFIGDFVHVLVEGTDSPWNLEYYENDHKKTITNIQGHSYEFQVSDAVYRIGKIWDRNCETNYKSLKSIVPAPFPRACGTGGGTIIKGESASIVVDLQGTAPWTVTYSFNGQTETKVAMKNPLVISVTEPGDFRLISVADSKAEGNVCGDVLKVTVIDPASASFDTTARKEVVCAGQSSENRLAVHLKGTPPWTLAYSINGEVFVEKTIRAPLFYIPVTHTGDYSLLEVSDIHTPKKTLRETLTVTSKEMPTAKWITAADVNICEGDSYPVKMEITGTPPFTVEYTVNGAKRTETVQPSTRDTTVISNKNNIQTVKTVHNLFVDRDGEYRLTSLRDPYCENLDLHDTLHVKKLTPPQCSVSGGECIGDTILIDCRGQAPWTLKYTFQGRTMTKTSYESHIEIAAEQDGIYNFETVTDGTQCVSSKILGSPVVVKTPKASLEKQGNVCEESGADLVVSLEGTAPWKLVVQKDTAESTQYMEYSDIYDPKYTIHVTDPAGKYSLKSVSDANCRSGIVAGGTIVKVPMARIEGGGEICKGDRLEIKVHLIGTPPWTFSYQVEDPDVPHRPKTKTEIWSSPFTFLTGTEGTYRILSVSDANCRGVISNDVAVVKVHQIPTAHISGGGEICPGSKAELLVDLTGEAPWTVTYMDDEGTSYTAKGITSSPTRIQTNKPGKYTLTSVADKYCKHERRS